MSKEKNEEKGTQNSIEFDKKKRKKKDLKINNKKKKLIQAKEQKNDSEAIEENIEEVNENTKSKNKVSKRQLKKERAELRAAEAKEASKLETAKKALNYVSKWKHIRSEWKFEKLKQIWLIDNLLSDKYISNENFIVILEYFQGCKGLARKQLTDKAMEVIKKIEDKIEEDKESVETEEYKRARQLLQILPIEA